MIPAREDSASFFWGGFFAKSIFKTCCACVFHTWLLTTLKYKMVVECTVEQKVYLPNAFLKLLMTIKIFRQLAAWHVTCRPAGVAEPRATAGAAKKTTSLTHTTQFCPNCFYPPHPTSTDNTCTHTHTHYLGLDEVARVSFPALRLYLITVGGWGGFSLYERY